MLKKYSLNRLLILFIAVGFAFLLLDTTIEHWDLLQEEIMVYIPLVFSLIGLVISLIAFFVWKDKIIRYSQLFVANQAMGS